MFRKKPKKIIFVILLVVFIVNLGVVGQISAQDNNSNSNSDTFNLNENINGQLNNISKIGLPGYDKEQDRITDVIFDVIRMVLGTLALIFLILVLIAGFRWMTSAGNEEAITKAKKMISSALIGIVIIFLAYAITAFVFMVLLTDNVM